MIKVDQKTGSKSQGDQERQKAAMFFVSESFSFLNLEMFKKKNRPLQAIHDSSEDKLETKIPGRNPANQPVEVGSFF